MHRVAHVDVPGCDARIGVLLLPSPGVAARGMGFRARVRAVAPPGLLLLCGRRSAARVSLCGGRIPVCAGRERDVLARRRNDPGCGKRMDGRRLAARGACLRLPPGCMPGTFVPGTADDEPGRDRRGGLDRQPGADRRATTAEERAQRPRKRGECKRLERATLRTLPALKRRAFGALTQVRPELAPLRSRQTGVELAWGRK